jgi:hypothetical protein
LPTSSQLSSELRSEPTYALARLIDALTKFPTAQQLEHGFFGSRSRRRNEVCRERAAVGLVGMEDADARVEAKASRTIGRLVAASSV